jgi:beta-glucosidase
MGKPRQPGKPKSTDPIQFPPDFIWGAATSAFQTEGNNTNTDWWEWENDKHPLNLPPYDKSGIACDSYKRYEEDLDLMVRLGASGYRMSVEWARVEPKEGSFDHMELDHYRKVLTAAKKRGLKTFVTLHHFTNPIWFAKKGGWKNLQAPRFFEKYAKKCAQELGDLIDVFLTINEPQVYVLQCYIKGVWPPFEEDILSGMLVQQNMISAHKRAYRAIKSVGDFKVGLVKNIVWYEYAQGQYDFIDNIMTKLLFWSNCDEYLDQIKNQLDLIGVNYYFTTRLKNLTIANKDDVQSDLGWWVNPEGLEKILLHLRKYNLPIYITENGVADQMDRIRKDFIKNMLIAAQKAIRKGVLVKGYFYWSLIDNYEWNQGFWPKFGLVYVQRENHLARIPRDSFNYYAQICKTGKIENDAHSKKQPKKTVESNNRRKSALIKTV